MIIIVKRNKYKKYKPYIFISILILIVSLIYFNNEFKNQEIADLLAIQEKSRLMMIEKKKRQKEVEDKIYNEMKQLIFYLQSNNTNKEIEPTIVKSIKIVKDKIGIVLNYNADIEFLKVRFQENIFIKQEKHKDLTKILINLKAIIN